jgi:hypothetical protein
MFIRVKVNIEVECSKKGDTGCCTYHSNEETLVPCHPLLPSHLYGPEKQHSLPNTPHNVPLGVKDVQGGKGGYGEEGVVQQVQQVHGEVKGVHHQDLPVVNQEEEHGAEGGDIGVVREEEPKVCEEE